MFLDDVRLFERVIMIEGIRDVDSLLSQGLVTKVTGEEIFIGLGRSMPRCLQLEDVPVSPRAPTSML